VNDQVNELNRKGSTASSGSEWIRPDLAREAVRLARILARLVPDESEAHGLLALLELTAARFPARLDDDGEPILLEEQDRRRWDRAAIRRGRAALVQAGQVGRGLGAYGVQAAIAECHAVAPSAGETDWERIVLLYEALGRLAPSPVVELNRAVAISFARGPATALAAVDDLVAAGALSASHLLPSVRGELLSRLGKLDDARREIELAVRLWGNERGQPAPAQARRPGLTTSDSPHVRPGWRIRARGHATDAVIRWRRPPAVPPGACRR
jgi:predicted RNA polymerase sigma factor